MTIGNLHGVARPGRSIRRAFGILHGKGENLSIDRALAETSAVLGLGKVIEEAVTAVRTTDGRIDSRDVAARVVEALAKSRPFRPTLESRIHDATMITSLARLITEAIETQQGKDGAISWNDVAAHVFAEMRNNQR